MHSKKTIRVKHSGDYIIHIIRSVGIFRNNRIQFLIFPVHGIIRTNFRRII